VTRVTPADSFTPRQPGSQLLCRPAQSSLGFQSNTIDLSFSLGEQAPAFRLSTAGQPQGSASLGECLTMRPLSLSTGILQQKCSEDSRRVACTRSPSMPRAPEPLQIHVHGISVRCESFAACWLTPTRSSRRRPWSGTTQATVYKRLSTPARNTRLVAHSGSFGLQSKTAAPSERELGFRPSNCIPDFLRHRAGLTAGI
jgi:hypothetical protein